MSLRPSAAEYKPSLSLHLKTLNKIEELEKRKRDHRKINVLDNGRSWKSDLDVIGTTTQATTQATIQATTQAAVCKSGDKVREIKPLPPTSPSSSKPQEGKSIHKKIDTEKARGRWWSKTRAVLEDDVRSVSSVSDDDYSPPRRSRTHLQPHGSVAFPPHIRLPPPSPPPPPRASQDAPRVPKQAAPAAARRFSTMKDVLDFVSSLPPHTPLSEIPLPNPLEPTKKQKARAQLKFKQATSILLSPSLHPTVKLAMITSYLPSKSLPSLLSSTSTLPSEML